MVSCSRSEKRPWSLRAGGLERVYEMMLVTDSDECDRRGDEICEQICINIVGSYRCGCRQSYVLTSDGITCKGTYTRTQAYESSWKQLHMEMPQGAILKPILLLICINHWFTENSTFSILLTTTRSYEIMISCVNSVR